jgi:alpha-glucosidase (family GH31 glycosyl hydrolase)
VNRIPWVVIAAAIAVQGEARLGVARAQSPAGEYARTATVTSLTGLRADVTWNPLRVTVREPATGRVVSQLGASGIPALFFESDAGSRAVQGDPIVERTTLNGYRATYALDASRRAEVELQWTAAETLLVTLRFEPDGEIRRLGAQLPVASDEHFVGLLERTVDNPAADGRPLSAALDLRGQTVSMFVKPTHSLYLPFYLSSAGYGVFVEGTWPGVFDLAASRGNTTAFSFEGPELKFHVIPGPDPAAILGRYVQVAGRPLVPPKWAFLPWRYRDEHVNLPRFYDGTAYSGPYNSQVVEDVLMLQALDIPLGVYWIDRPWAVGHEGYDDFTWDRRRVPNPERMIRWLDDKGIRFLLWLAPWIQGSIVDEAKRRGFLMPDLASQNDHAHVDFTNPGATVWWQDCVRTLVDAGVAGFKLDRGDEEVPGRVDLRTADGRTTREVHNDYPRLYAGAAHQLLTARRPDDFILMARSGYTGSQSLAAFWAGDSSTSEWGLRQAIIAAQRAAVMGFSLWGTDIGGYGISLDREVLARWIAFGAFTPIMQVGPTENRGLWDMPTEPRYDTELIAIWRLYAKLHTALQNYSVAHALIARETGVPMIRPLFLAFPDDRRAWDTWEEFFYGDDILVGAIWRKGQRAMSVYLPEGDWLDMWNPTRLVSGPITLTVDCPMYKIPIFIRPRAATARAMGDLNALWDDSLKRAREKPNLAAMAAAIH